MVVALEFCAREGAAQWMNRTLQQFPDCNTIILTHYHLNADNTVATHNNGYGDMAPSDIFDGYIKPHKNVFMILSGHTCLGSTWRVDKGVHDNNICQVFQNYQCLNDWHRNVPADSYLRLLEFDLKNKTIAAKMYSPYLKATLNDDSKFTLINVNFIK
jgi:hypothetical protein